MDLSQFISENLYIVVAALWVIGYFLKNIEKIKDEYIIFILMIIGVGFSVWITMIESGKVTPESILQGIICAACAVLVENIKKQGASLVKGDK